jgi:hypothetical protein
VMLGVDCKRRTRSLIETYGAIWWIALQRDYDTDSATVTWVPSMISSELVV